MKRKLRKILAAVFVAALLAAAAGFVGCSGGDWNPSRLPPDQRTVIRFDYNGGKVGNYNYHELYIKKGSPLPTFKAVEDALNIELIPTYTGFVFEGFFLGEKEENGIKFGEGYKEGTRFDGDTVFYAKWSRSFVVQVKCVGNSACDTTSDVFSSEKPTLDKTLFRSGMKRWKGHTFVDLYRNYDENTGEFSGLIDNWADYTHALDYDDPVETLYARYVEGEYTVLLTSADVKEKVKTNSTNTNFYLARNIDCGGDAIQFPLAYGGDFAGNGFKLSNFSVDRTVATNDFTSGNSAGLISLLGATGMISDLTLENYILNITGQSNQIVSLNAFIGRADDGAAGRVRGVKISGATVNYSLKTKDGGSVQVDIDHGRLITEGFAAADATCSISNANYLEKE